MQVDPHERARFLSDEALIAGVSPADEVWLRGHLGACRKCARYAETGTSVVRGLHSISFDLDPEMNARVQRAVMARARLRGSAWRWALAAAAILIVVIYRSDENRRTAEAALLLDGVHERVSRTVPVAMEPLAIAEVGGAQ